MELPLIFQQIMDMMKIDYTTIQEVKNVKQSAIFPQKCFSTARSFVESGNATHYVEGFLMPDGLPIPIGHAWFINSNGEHVDMTHIDKDDIYFGFVIPASEFRKNMENPDFVKSYERHDMLPYLRAVNEFKNKSGGKKKKKQLKKK
jgi:hypothetical protein